MGTSSPVWETNPLQSEVIGVILMQRFLLLAMLPSGVKILTADGLTPREKDILLNYGLPFGSDWNSVEWVRAIKLFLVNPVDTCLAYTVITHTHPLLDLEGDGYCLAAIFSNSEIRKNLISGSTWVEKLLSPILEGMDQSIKEVFKKSMHVGLLRSRFSIAFSDWIRVQLHMKLLKSYPFYDIESWTAHEEYARRLYISTDWQRRILESVQTIPVIRHLLPTYKPLTFSTLSMSSGEHTQIVFLAIPKTPINRVKASQEFNITT
jgi:hypothetical protein